MGERTAAMIAGMSKRTMDDLGGRLVGRQQG